LKVIKPNSELTQAGKKHLSNQGSKRRKRDSPTDSDCSRPATPNKPQEADAAQVQVKQEIVKHEHST
jgi:hypothetical protein